jgi:5-methylcytosine-specific restriction protein A
MVNPIDKGQRIVQRIRGRKLQRIRASVLQANPLCVMCEAQSIVALATEVDHTQALVNGGKDTQDNRQGLCKECHAVKTAKDMGHKPRVTIGLDGWPMSAPTPS